MRIEVCTARVVRVDGLHRPKVIAADPCPTNPIGEGLANSFAGAREGVPQVFSR
jgi:hypothetical protein